MFLLLCLYLCQKHLLSKHNFINDNQELFSVSQHASCILRKTKRRQKREDARKQKPAVVNVYLLLRAHFNSLSRGRFYVWASGLCSLYRRIRYIEVLFHTFYCNFGQDIECCSLYRGSLNRGSTVSNSLSLK